MPPPTAPSPSRRLLRRVRDVMAGEGAAQHRLDMVTTIIAAEMVAEVCSIYLSRGGAVLELFASKGLKGEAVHRTRLRFGEGLVGRIAARARPLALKDAQSHPDFAYRPETGEEIYHSLMGVPILRDGQPHGVLVVQNRTMRDYTEEEIETLETVAMVLAELIFASGLIAIDPVAPGPAAAGRPERLEGQRLSPGLASGTAVPHRVPIAVDRVVADDAAEELLRLDDALAGMQSALDDLLETSDLQEPGEHQEVLETYRMFAADEGWMRRMREAVEGGLTAEAAVQKVQGDTQARMSRITDPYLRERLADLDDLAGRLLRHLTGRAETAAAADLPDDAVLTARTMGPAELLDYAKGAPRALLLEEGTAGSHVAIVARAMNLPVIGGLRGLADTVRPGDPIIVDADNGQVLVRPGEDVRDEFIRTMRARDEARELYAALRDKPAVTLDGVRVDLHINAGLLVDVQRLDECGAAGIGLYRTEIPFMVRSAFPDLDEQTRLYARVIELAAGRPVAFRTLDLGGDKLLPYLAMRREDNPAMGWRAIRLGLDRPMMLRTQLRALIRATAGGDLCVMFPMVAEVGELDSARAVLDREIAQAAVPPASVRVGAMLEVPSLCWQLSDLLSRVDFLSVGSNDLLQFVFASDRGNPRMTERYDPLSPAFLRLLADVVAACDRAGVDCTLCGEIAGRPLEAMALIGIGFRNLSMTPAAIGPVKAMIRHLRLQDVRDYLQLLADSGNCNPRPYLTAFARDHGMEL